MTLKEAIGQHSLLNHPFYQAWMDGKLSIPDLKTYAKMYHPFVEAFPRFVSAIHSRCEDAESRKALFLNLAEEEGMSFDKDHPELWVQFANGLGVSTNELDTAPTHPATRELINFYFDFCRGSAAQGLGALYAYEFQSAQIARAKIEGLKKNFKIDDPKTLAFFQVHEKADEGHSEICEKLIDALPMDQGKEALASAQASSQELWQFLTAIEDECQSILNS